MATVTVDGTNYDLTNGIVTNELDEFTFANLATAGVDWSEWTSWDGFGLPTGISIPSTLTFNTEAVDLGAKKNVLPTVVCETNSSTAHTISFLISDDDSSYSAASAGSLSARYIKTKVVVTNTAARPGFKELSTDFTEDVISESLFNVTVTHSSNEFTLPITKTYSKILAITGTQNSSVSGSYAVIPTDYTAGSPKVKVVNLDTFGKVIADVNIDVLVSGLPGITTESNGNISSG